MKVAMLGWELPPFVSGGLGVHCYYLTRELAALGAEIDFYMPKTRLPVRVPWMNVIEVVPPASELTRTVLATIGPYSTSVSVTGGTSATGQLTGPPSGFFESVAFYNEFAAGLVAANHKRRHYNLIHGHDWLTARAAGGGKRETGLPLVETMHSTEFDRTGNVGPWEWIVGFEREAVLQADRVIAVSGMLRDILVNKLDCPAGKVRVVHNGVDSGRFWPRNGGRLGPKVVLFHGRLSVQKGPEFFLRAAKLVLEVEPDALFVVSGKGELLERLVHLSIDLGISDRVLFAGYVPDELLQEAYASASVYVMPSVSEPFGITALEAMASGVPCIVSKTSGVTEVARHCMRVDFWDTVAMADRIVGVLRHEPLRRMMSENAVVEASAVTWRKAAEQTMRVYGEIA
jgi:glycosyltransferase involved in cell wall biosynthesis